MRWLLSFMAWALVASMADIFPASAQEPGRVYRVGWLVIGRPGLVIPPMEKWTNPGGVAIRDALQNSGFALGKNLIVEARNAQGDQDRLAAEVESLVAANVDVIITQGTPPTVAALNGTKPVPVVFFGVGDPVEKGIIASLAKPGGNATGMAVLISYGKLWQLLHEISPSTRRVAVVSNERNSMALSQERRAPYRAFFNKRMTDEATAVGLESIRTPVNSLDEAGSKLAEFAIGGNAGILISTDAILFDWRAAIMEMALKNRMPSACPQDRGWAEAGCLVTYTENYGAAVLGTGATVVKVLRGAKPADIPAEQPASSFKLIINAKTAKALDLTVPPALLAMADEVIE
jgi:putative tryptophan/tyrosine transport system substrate-binding protein